MNKLRQQQRLERIRKTKRDARSTRRHAIRVPLLNSFHEYIHRYDELLTAARAIAPARATPPVHPPVAKRLPAALIFAPHPDDEAITGALALRLRKEGTYRIINVAVTLGSLSKRRAERKVELEKACRYLGFDLVHPLGTGLEKIALAARTQKTPAWREAVARITNLINRHTPRILIFPHANDWNSTHVGTHYLVMDALRASNIASCFLVETEFWHPMEEPGFMLASSPEEVAELVTAVSFHAGEIRRNPYHLALPSWMHDNVRRGTERLFGQGESAPPCHFATLYCLKHWQNGVAKRLKITPPLVGPFDDVSRLFATDRKT